MVSERATGHNGRLVFAIVAIVVGAWLRGGSPWDVVAQSPNPCTTSPVNPIACENSKTGNPASEWDISGSGSAAIQGFTTDISVNRGQTIKFKVTTTASAFRIDIYRLGYYAGLGARKIATVTSTTAKAQPNCYTDGTTGLVDCGNWSQSASWAVPSSAISGIYIAKLVMTAGGTGSSHVPFIVRDDSGHSDILFQTSDTTWHAYNQYGGNSFYAGSPAGRAYEVSYNRPITTRGTGPEDSVFNAEYPMVRWLEANGYNVSYTTGVDSDRRGAEILEHAVFLSVGHDEYWSGAQRANVEAARAAGVNLAFFSGNEVFWKTRWDTSIDGTATTYRTLVCYKETHAGAKIDPQPLWTGTWRDPRFSPPYDGGRPENGLTGTAFTVNAGTSAIKVPEAFGKARLWRNTSVATQSAGQTATLAADTLGYEWDSDLDNGARPAGLMPLSSTSVSGVQVLLDYGSSYGTGTASHSLTLYRHSSGALVFGAGTVQWSWGLDGTHDRGGSTPDTRMRQATVNLLADMGVQPSTLQSGLVAATESTDTIPPTSVISAPATGSTVAQGTAVTVSGTATDLGGFVTAVEVSVDAGATWRRANGRGSWTFGFTTGSNGTVIIRSRGVDDSGNIENPGPSVSITVGTGGQDTIPPTVTSMAPAAGATNVDVGANVTATFSEAMTASTITSASVELRNAANQPVAAAITYNASTRTVTLDPSAALAAGATYTATIRGGATDPRVKDAAGNALAANVVRSFTTAATPGACPCSLWSSSATPATIADPDTAAITVGVKFQSDRNGYISALRFYKAATNTGTHVGSIWTAAGALLGTVTFGTETASGWQQATFASPIAVTANTVYVASYFAPAGHYSADSNFFASALDRPPLHAPSNGTSANGLYKYGASSAFPNLTYNASNYWVDVVFVDGTDTTPPTVTGQSPAGGATGVALTAPVTATFSESLDAATVGTTTFELRNGTTLVPSTVSYDATTRTATLQPQASLAGSTAYTVTIRGGAADPRIKDAAQNALAANVTWSFTTVAPPPADTTPPVVSSATPAAGAASVAVAANVTATFSEAMMATSITSASFELRDAASLPVSAAVSYNAATLTATLDPSANLAPGATYTVTVHGGTTDPRVKDAAGNALAANVAWSFSTSTSACPCSIWAASAVPAVIDDGDTSGVTLGVKFQSDRAGYITALRFYKGAANTGSHVGGLWTSSGTLLATVTFAAETASGWQQAVLNPPVAITANTVYVASYFAPVGHYSADVNFFASALDRPPLHALSNGTSVNGVYKYGTSSTFPNLTYNASNYWVDVVFVDALAANTATPGAPMVTASIAPASPRAATVVDDAIAVGGRQ